MSSSIIIQIENTEPEKLSAKDLGDYFAAFETLMIEQVREMNCDVDLQELYLSPTAINNKCVQLEFVPSDSEHGMPAYANIVEDLSQNKYSNLNAKAMKVLHRIKALDKKYQAKTTFMRKDHAGNLVVAAEIPDVLPENHSTEIQGMTDLYGEVLRVGGAKECKASLRTSGQLLNVELKKELAQQLAKSLYQEVCVRGIAVWDTHTLELKSFEALEVLEIHRASLTEVFAQLRQVVGSGLDDLDVEAYVNQTR